MAFSKVILNNETLMDVTNDTVVADKLLSGYTAHDKSGTVITGTIIDGNEIGYGLTDGTLPLVGVAKAGYAEI